MMKILAAIDLSAGSDEALRQAAALGGSLTVLHVMPDVIRINALFPQMSANAAVDSADLEARVKRAVDERIEAVIPGSKAERIVDAGTDYARILEHAEESKADFIVVGARGHEKNELLGSTAERVVRYAHCPVLVARPSNAKGCVVAATDLSDPAAPAVHAAAREAASRSAPLVVVHAVDTTLGGYFAALGLAFGGSAIVPGAESAGRDALRALLEETIEKVGAKGEAIVADGPADREILRVAEEKKAGLIVVATHGHTGWRRVALGSVSERVIRGANCSVLVVRI
jgi:nucleotide-binding universal stress UspA family protein